MANIFNDKQSIVIRIPRDHPKANALLKLASALAYRTQLESGVIIDKIARPDADKEFLDALRDFVDVDEILSQLPSKEGLTISPPMIEIAKSIIAGVASPELKEYLPKIENFLK